MFEIYSIGDAAFLEQVLIGLAMITSTSSFISMASIACLIGVIFAMFESVMNGGKSINLHHVLLGVLLFLMLFVPKVTVVIEDAYTGDLHPVEDVPIGPAFAGTLISTIGLGITEMFEHNYGIIAPGITEKTYLDSLELLTDVRRRISSPPVFTALDAAVGSTADTRMSISNYVRECTHIKLQQEGLNISDLSDIPALESIKFDHNAYETMLYLDEGPKQYTCSTGWTKLAAALSKVTEDDVQVAIGQVTGHVKTAVIALPGGGSIPSRWPGGESPLESITNSMDSLNMLSVAAEDAKDFTQASIIEPIFYEALLGAYSDVQDANAAIMVNQAIQQRNTQWVTEQSLFMSTVRPLMAFFEAFVFAISPIAAFILLLGSKGIALAGKYLMLILFIQLWYPILSITNLYIYMAAAGEMGSYDLPSWSSLYALELSSQVLGTWIATGGMLAAATPMFAMMLLYGSAYTATALAGRMSSADHVNEKITSPDAVTPGAYMQDASRYMNNDATGATRSGMAGTMDQFNMGSNVSSSLRSDDTSSLAHSSNAMNTLMSGLTNTGNSQKGFNTASTMGRDLVSGTGSSFDSTAKQAFEHAKSQGASDEVAYATATYVYGQAQGGLNLSKMISGGPKKGDAPQQAENSDDSVVEKAAGMASSFWNSFGGTSSKSNGNSTAPTTANSGDGGKGSDSGSPTKVTATGSANVGAAVRDTDNYTNGSKINSSDAQTNGVSISQADNAKIARSIMAKTDQSEQATYAQSLSAADGETFNQSANTARSNIEAYSQSYELSQNFGGSQNPSAVELYEALQNPVDPSDPSSGTYGDMLSRELQGQNASNTNSKQLNDAVTKKQNALMTNNHIGEEKAKTMAMVSAFNNPLNFTDKDGNLDHNSYNNARESVGRAVAGGLGNPYADADPFKNQHLPQDNSQYVPNEQDEAEVRAKTEGSQGLHDQKGQVQSDIQERIGNGITMPSAVPGEPMIMDQHQDNLDAAVGNAQGKISQHQKGAYSDAHENLRKLDQNPDLYTGGDFEGVKMVAAAKDALATASAGITGIMKAAEVAPEHLQNAREQLAEMTPEQAKEYIQEADKSRDEFGALSANTVDDLYEKVTGNEMSDGAREAITAIGSTSEGGAQFIMGLASQPLIMNSDMSESGRDLAGHTLTQEEVSGLNDDLGTYLYSQGVVGASDMFNGSSGIVPDNARDVPEGGGNSALGYFMYSEVYEPSMNEGIQAYQGEMTARTDKQVDEATTGWGAEGVQEKALFSAYMHGDEDAMNQANESLVEKYSDKDGNISQNNQSMLDGMNEEMSDAAKTGQHAQINLENTHKLVMSQKGLNIDPKDDS